MPLPKKKQFIQEVVEPQIQIPVEPQILQEIVTNEVVCAKCLDGEECIDGECVCGE